MTGNRKDVEKEGRRGKTPRGSTWAEQSSVLDPARLARFLGFLIDAKRWEGITQTSAALNRGTFAGNLSVFISTHGVKQNISPTRVVQILFDLGAHPQGILTPGLHRWDLGTMEPDRLETFGELLALNRTGTTTLPVLLTVRDEACFLLHRVSRLTTVLARAPMALRPPVESALQRWREGHADIEEASELQTLWMTKHNWVVERAIDTYTRRARLVLGNGVASASTTSPTSMPSHFEPRSNSA